MQGIDVSVDQGRIDWEKVRADGVDFAVVKATQGRGEGALTRLLPRFTVSTFKANVLGAAAAGLDVSVYHYFTGDTTERAISEADYFLDAIEPYHDKISGYAAVDVESKPYLSGLTPARLAAAVEAFVQRVYQRGFQPLIYTNPDFLVYKLPASFRNDHDIWLAHWGVSRPFQVPYLQMWQYGAGYVDGIRGLVDLDVGYYDTREQIRAWKVGDVYTLKSGDKWSNGNAVPSRLIGRQYPVIQVKDNALLLGGIVSWVKI